MDLTFNRVELTVEDLRKKPTALGGLLTFCPATNSEKVADLKRIYESSPIARIKLSIEFPGLGRWIAAGQLITMESSTDSSGDCFAEFTFLPDDLSKTCALLSGFESSEEPSACMSPPPVSNSASTALQVAYALRQCQTEPVVKQVTVSAAFCLTANLAFLCPKAS